MFSGSDSRLQHKICSLRASCFEISRKGSTMARATWQRWLSSGSQRASDAVENKPNGACQRKCLDAQVDGLVKASIATFLCAVEDLEGVRAHLGLRNNVGTCLTLERSGLHGTPHDQQQRTAVLKLLGQVRPSTPAFPFKPIRCVPERRTSLI